MVAIPAPLRVEERLSSLEARMTALEQLPGRIDRLASELGAEIRAVNEALREEMRTGHVMIVTELTERIEESQRDARKSVLVQHARITVVGEGLAANVTGLRALDEKVDMIHTRLSGSIDASRAETRAMFEQVFNRLDALTATRNRPRRSKKL